MALLAGLTAIFALAMAVPLLLSSGVAGRLQPGDGLGAIAAPSASNNGVLPAPSTGLAGAAPTALPRDPAAPDPSSPARAGTPAVRMVISRLAIDLPVVEGDGVDAPLNKAAHFPGTGWPGSGSNIYLYGHARSGMFIDLWQAQLGDAVELTLADGSVKSYRVSQILPEVPYDAVELLEPTASEQLTLQTCTAFGQTAPRFVVIAVPVDA